MSPPSRTKPSGAPAGFIGNTPLAVPIQATHPLGDFDSGEPQLDAFLQRHALGNDAHGIGRTYLLLRGPADPVGLPAVIGFYTLSMADVASAALRPHERHHLPGYDLPIGLIGRLAVDRNARGRGFGQVLLIDALGQIATASLLLGCLGVAVDAKHESARDFYRHFGFVELNEAGWPRRMYLPMATVWQLLSGPEHEEAS